MDGVRGALRAMLGPDAGIGVTDPAAGGYLWPAEKPAIARAIPKRQAEFAAGRSAARAALAAIGIAPIAILQHADRAPRWPAGITGSIAHCDSCCIAAVARQTDIGAMGIDVEPATALDPDLIPTICTPAERRWIATTPDPGFAAKQIFSAKEAVFKAQYPLTGQVIGFDAVSLTLTGDSFIITAGPSLPPLKGVVLIQEGLILTAALG